MKAQVTENRIVLTPENDLENQAIVRWSTRNIRGGVGYTCSTQLPWHTGSRSIGVLGDIARLTLDFENDEQCPRCKRYKCVVKDSLGMKSCVLCQNVWADEKEPPVTQYGYRCPSCGTTAYAGYDVAAAGDMLRCIKPGCLEDFKPTREMQSYASYPTPEKPPLMTQTKGEIEAEQKPLHNIITNPRPWTI